MRIVDEFDGGVGWICDEPMARTSHALRTEGGTWLVDPLEPVPAELEAVRGVIQLLDRHNRDCAALARRFGVPHVWGFEGAGETPFELVRVARNRWWREVALWWPERRVLVCADALGTLPFFRTSKERIGVHPLLRLTPPRRLRGLDAERILVGHGLGIHEDAADALREAIATARRRAPKVVLDGVRTLRRRRGDADM